jgi:hypothetical protein
LPGSLQRRKRWDGEESGGGARGSGGRARV